MSTPDIRNKKKRTKLVVRLGGLNDIRLGTPAHPPTFAPSPATTTTTTAPATSREPSITDYTFEQYQAAHLNFNQKHVLISKLRAELPIIDRDEVDEVLLRSMAQQLQLAVFPTCKMMQVDPVAVKRMLDDEFRRAYGVQVEAGVLRELGLVRLEDVGKVGGGEGVGMVDGEGEEDVGRGQSVVKSQDTAGEEDGEHAVIATRPLSKKVKRAPLSNTQKEIRAYVARKKRGRRGCKMLTLRSDAVSQKWEALTKES